MTAKEIYDEMLELDPTIGTVELMEMYAKHVIDYNFLDGSPDDFNKMTIVDLKRVHNKINDLLNA